MCDPPDDTLRGLTAVSGGISESGANRKLRSKRPVSRDLTIPNYKAIRQLFNDVTRPIRCYQITKAVFNFGFPLANSRLFRSDIFARSAILTSLLTINSVT